MIMIDENVSTSPVEELDNTTIEEMDEMEDAQVDYVNLEFDDEEDMEYACEWAEDLAILDAEGFNDDGQEYLALDDLFFDMEGRWN